MTGQKNIQFSGNMVQSPFAFLQLTEQKCVSCLSAQEIMSVVYLEQSFQSTYITCNDLHFFMDSMAEVL